MIVREDLLLSLQRCPTDVFVDNIWMPAIKSGHLTNLEESLRSHDPTLAVWEPYLTAVCRLLSQKSLLNVLYHTQLFMKVSVLICSFTYSLTYSLSLSLTHPLTHPPIHSLTLSLSLSHSGLCQSCNDLY